ncbi:MAG: aliphatic sulfonate ABC transporter substrate-binding protein [Spirochaetaceae bacterium]|jgi:taurine transport system substrate-binding protein|nr:aliphatic sulfonate ABC transporter substrate-binding protein [Spirochaetaceae bacterium]
MKKKNVPALVLVAFIIAGIFSGCSRRRDTVPENKSAVTNLPDSVNIGTQQIPNDENIAKAKNFFSAMGITVKLREFESGASVVSALASGSIDLGLVGTTPAVTAISNNLGVELIWIHGILGKSEALAVKNNSAVNSVKDLTGKKIGVPFGSTAHYSLLSAFELNGVDTGAVSILDMQPADIYAAWQRGDINAAYVWEPTLTKLLTDGRLLITSEDLAKEGAVTADVEVVRKEFGDAYPELVAEYIRILSRAQTIYEENLDEAVSILADYFDISNEESRNQILGNVWLSAREQLSPQYLGTSGNPGAIADALKKTADFLVKQQSIKEAPELTVFQKAVNPRYIELSLK